MDKLALTGLLFALLGHARGSRAGDDCDFLPCWEAPECCPDTCPCWTPEELAAIQPMPSCENCGNWIEPGGPPTAEATCIHINGAPKGTVGDACAWGYPRDGWVSVWDQANLAGGSPPGCFIAAYNQGIDDRKVSSLTPAQAAACIADVEARGTAIAEANPGVPFACLGQCFPPDCEMSVFESVCDGTLAPCASNAECAIPGACTIDGEPCLDDGDCVPVGTCAGGGSELCHATADCPTRCSQTALPCVDETQCPGTLNVCTHASCNGLNAQLCAGASPGACGDRLAFTHQAFDLVTGLASDVVADHDYTNAECLGVQTPVLDASPFASIADPTAALGPGQARYYLTRAVEGVSCRDHGDSSLVPDPRDPLDGTCP
jgi:hypothetical protein